MKKEVDLSRNKNIDHMIGKIDGLLEDINHTFLGKNVYKNTSDADILDRFNKIKKLVINFYELISVDEDKLEVLNENVFNHTDAMINFDKGKVFIYLNKIKDILILSYAKNINKELLLGNLKSPFSWSNIKILFDGQNIKIKQNDTFIHDCSVFDIGIPKKQNNGKKSGMFNFFVAIFMLDENNITEIYKKMISSKIDLNQKHKSDLSILLRKLFHTNVDPFYIDTNQRIYKAKFQKGLYGELQIEFEKYNLSR